MSREKRATLAGRMRKDSLVVAPGIFDMISAKIADRLGFECLYVEGGRTPLLDASALQEIGYRIAIFPGLGFLAAGGALERAYGELKRAGSSQGITVPLYDFKRFSALMGFDDVAEFDRRYRGE